MITMIVDQYRTTAKSPGVETPLLIHLANWSFGERNREAVTTKKNEKRLSSAGLEADAGLERGLLNMESASFEAPRRKKLQRSRMNGSLSLLGVQRFQDLLLLNHIRPSHLRAGPNVSAVGILTRCLLTSTECPGQWTPSTLSFCSSMTFSRKSGGMSCGCTLPGSRSDQGDYGNPAHSADTTR